MAKQRICAGYELRVQNSPKAFWLQLVVTGDDGKEYHLDIDDPENQPADGPVTADRVNESPGLVIQLLKALGELWPGYAFKFEADASRVITKISAS
jgi:hypothetical protein